MVENQRQLRFRKVIILAFLLLIVSMIPITILSISSNSPYIIYYILLDFGVVLVFLNIYCIIDYLCCNRNGATSKKDDSMMMKALKTHNPRYDNGFGNDMYCRSGMSSQAVILSLGEDGIYFIDPSSTDIGGTSCSMDTGGGGCGGGDSGGGGCDGGGGGDSGGGGGTCD